MFLDVKLQNWFALEWKKTGVLTDGSQTVSLSGNGDGDELADAGRADLDVACLGRGAERSPHGKRGDQLL